MLELNMFIHQIVIKIFWSNIIYFFIKIRRKKMRAEAQKDKVFVEYKRQVFLILFFFTNFSLNNQNLLVLLMLNFLLLMFYQLKFNKCTN